MADEGLTQVGSLPLCSDAGPCVAGLPLRNRVGRFRSALEADGSWVCVCSTAPVANAVMRRGFAALAAYQTAPLCSPAPLGPYLPGAQEAVQQAAGGAQLLGQEEAGAQDGERAAQEGAPQAQALRAPARRPARMRYMCINCAMITAKFESNGKEVVQPLLSKADGRSVVSVGAQGENFIGTVARMRVGQDLPVMQVAQLR